MIKPGIMNTRLRSTGHQQHVTGPGAAAADEPPHGAHDWAILVQFRLSESEAAQASEGLEQVLDADKVVYWTPAVCMRCEHAHGHVAGKPCPGEPHRYRKGDGRPEWHVRDNLWTPDPWRHLNEDGGW